MIQGVFKGHQAQQRLVGEAVCWYLRYPLNYRDIEELFLERGLPVAGFHPEPLGPGLCAADRASGWDRSASRIADRDSHRRDLHQPQLWIGVMEYTTDQGFDSIGLRRLSLKSGSAGERQG